MVLAATIFGVGLIAEVQSSMSGQELAAEKAGAETFSEETAPDKPVKEREDEARKRYEQRDREEGESRATLERDGSDENITHKAGEEPGLEKSNADGMGKESPQEGSELDETSGKIEAEESKAPETLKNPPPVDGLLGSFSVGTLEEPPLEDRAPESTPTEIWEEWLPVDELLDSFPYGMEPDIEVPKAIELLWLRELTEIQSGRNDSNPVWSPTGELIAFERSIGDKKEIIIASPVGSIAQKVYLKLNGDDDGMQFFLPGISEEVSYNAGLSWSPGGDRFVIMSNAGGGNYDLYLGSIGNDEMKRLTEHPAKDGLAHWSPAADYLAFVSGRTGQGDIYMIDLETHALRRLTQGDKPYLYPQWSPDGQKIVLTCGSNDNHDIYLIGDVEEPFTTLKPLTTWPYDDLRPVWSPDGKRIAFYTNYNKEDNPKVWSLVVVAADGSDPLEGEGLAMRVVAMDIVPDITRGPAWMPDSNRIVYVKNDRQAYNPIYVVDIEERTNLLLKTGVKMSHDVTCSAEGTIAFRAQVEQWDHIHVAKLKEQ